MNRQLRGLGGKNIIRLLLLAGTVSGLGGSTGRAADPAPTNAPTGADTRAAAVEQFNALQKEISDVEVVKHAYQSETNEVKSNKLWKNYQAKTAALVPKIFAAASQAPDSPLAVPSIEWAVQTPAFTSYQNRSNAISWVEILRDHFTASTNLGTICRAVYRSHDMLGQTGKEFLEAVAAKNPEHAARGYAAFGLAIITKDQAEWLAAIDAVPPSTNSYPEYERAKADLLAATQTRDAKIVYQRASAQFEAVIKQYGDGPDFTPTPGSRNPLPTLGDRARIELYECQHLSPGCVAPDIEGVDLAGKPLKLSDYRGKVVLLTFWASWCGPCMAMVPVERELARQFQGQPFAQIGVNGDKDQKAALNAVEKEKMTWPSYWCGGAEGAIPTAWNLHGWPTVYFIDTKGIIRLKSVGMGPTMRNLMTNQISRLLAETAAKP